MRLDCFYCHAEWSTGNKDLWMEQGLKYEGVHRQKVANDVRNFWKINDFWTLHDEIEHKNMLLQYQLNQQPIFVESTGYK